MAKLRDVITQAVEQNRPKPDNDGEASPQADDVPHIGLAQNADGVPFQCGTCEYFENGICHNDHPELSGKQVQPDWCCDLYDHEGMQHIID